MLYQANTMATTKTATLTFRIEPSLKEALRTAAELEHRSIANMVEMMIREHCERSGIAIVKLVAASGDERHTVARHSAT